MTMASTPSGEASIPRRVTPISWASIKRERSDEEEETTRCVSPRTDDTDVFSMNELVLKYLQSNDQVVLYTTLEAIADLLYDGEKVENRTEIREEFFQLGGHASVVPVMKNHLECSRVQVQGISILMNGACMHKSLKEAIGRVGGIQAVLAAMRGHPNNEDISFSGLRAIKNLANIKPNAKFFTANDISFILECTEERAFRRPRRRLSPGLQSLAIAFVTTSSSKSP